MDSHTQPVPEPSRPPLGTQSFWHMAKVAMQGELASCESCVEHFYFQSSFNARAFLDSCAAAGLVEKVSLLDLLGQLGSKRSPTSQRYDQSIYLSAPDFRSRNPK